jgi:GTPase Era involved in 16S rRNA processing
LTYEKRSDIVYVGASSSRRGSQKGILIGRKSEMLRQIGSRAGRKIKRAGEPHYLESESK